MPFGRDVLDDHVHVHADVRQRAEDARRDPGPVGHAEDRHLRLRGVVRDSRDDRLLHQLLLTDDPRPLVPRERGADVDADSMVAGELDRAQHQDLGAGRGQLQHLLVRDGVELACLGNDARIGREDPLDIGVDLAGVGVECGCERDGRRVRPAPAERRHLELGRDALEAGDEHDRAPRKRLVDPLWADLEHLRARVLGVGDDARLRAREGDRGVPEVVDRHRGERARDPFTDREQHVELARVRGRRNLMGQVDEVVGRPAHRREDADDVVSGVARATSRRATACNRSGPATEVPPNFWTTRPMARSYLPLRSAYGGSKCVSAVGTRPGVVVKGHASAEAASAPTSSRRCGHARSGTRGTA